MPRGRRIYDISAPLCRSLPVWPGADRFSLTWLKTLRDDGVNESAISLNSHTGTHLDTPRHFIEGGRGLDGIPIQRLVGAAFVLEFDGAGDVDAEFLEEARVPSGCSKILIKSRNSSADMYNSDFTEDYTALGEDCAHWLVAKGIDLVGTDYLSIERFDHPENRVHKILLGSDILILEGLDLRGVPAGLYTLVALPLNVPEAEGAPTRAILIEGDII